MGIGFHHEGCIIAALELLLVDLRHASGKNLASSWGPFVSSEVERHTFESRGSWFVRNARLALAIRPAKSIWTPMTYQVHIIRSEENTSELQSLMRISYADFCL